MYHLIGQSDSSIYYWTMDMGWLWTSSQIYPFLYRLSNGGTWLYFQRGSVTPDRWFYDFTLHQWIKEGE